MEAYDSDINRDQEDYGTSPPNISGGKESQNQSNSYSKHSRRLYVITEESHSNIGGHLSTYRSNQGQTFVGHGSDIGCNNLGVANGKQQNTPGQTQATYASMPRIGASDSIGTRSSVGPSGNINKSEYQRHSEEIIKSSGLRNSLNDGQRAAGPFNVPLNQTQNLMTQNNGPSGFNDYLNGTINGAYNPYLSTFKHSNGSNNLSDLHPHHDGTSPDFRKAKSQKTGGSSNNQDSASPNRDPILMTDYVEPRVCNLRNGANPNLYKSESNIISLNETRGSKTEPRREEPTANFQADHAAHMQNHGHEENATPISTTYLRETSNPSEVRPSTLINSSNMQRGRNNTHLPGHGGSQQTTKQSHNNCNGNLQTPFEIISDDDLLGSNSNFDRISKILPAQDHLDMDHDCEKSDQVSGESPLRRGISLENNTASTNAIIQQLGNEINQLKQVIAIKDNTISELQEKTTMTAKKVANRSVAVAAQPSTVEAKTQTIGPRSKAYYDAIPAKIDTGLARRSPSEDCLQLRPYAIEVSNQEKVEREESISRLKSMKRAMSNQTPKRKKRKDSSSPIKSSKKANNTSKNANRVQQNTDFFSPPAKQQLIAAGINQVDDAKSLRVQLLSLKTQLNDQEADNLTLIERITALESSLTAKDKRLDRMEAKFKAKKTQNEELRESIEEMSKRIDSLMADNADLRGQLQKDDPSFSGSFNMTKVQIEQQKSFQLQESLKLAESSNTKLENKLKKLQEEIKNVVNEKQGIAKRLEEVYDDNQKLLAKHHAAVYDFGTQTDPIDWKEYQAATIGAFRSAGEAEHAYRSDQSNAKDQNVGAVDVRSTGAQGQTLSAYNQPSMTYGRNQDLLDQFSEAANAGGEQGTAGDQQFMHLLIKRANDYESQYQRIEQEIVEYKQALQDVVNVQASQQSFVNQEQLIHHHRGLSSASNITLGSIAAANQSQTRNYYPGGTSATNLNGHADNQVNRGQNQLVNQHQLGSARNQSHNTFSHQNLLGTPQAVNANEMGVSPMGDVSSRIGWLEKHLAHYKKKARKLEKRYTKMQFEKVTSEKLIQDLQQKLQEMNEKYRDLKQKYQMKLQEKHLKIGELRNHLSQARFYAGVNPMYHAGSQSILDHLGATTSVANATQIVRNGHQADQQRIVDKLRQQKRFEDQDDFSSDTNVLDFTNQNTVTKEQWNGDRQRGRDSLDRERENDAHRIKRQPTKKKRSSMSPSRRFSPTKNRGGVRSRDAQKQAKEDQFVIAGPYADQDIQYRHYNATQSLASQAVMSDVSGIEPTTTVVNHAAYANKSTNSIFDDDASGINAVHAEQNSAGDIYQFISGIVDQKFAEKHQQVMQSFDNGQNSVHMPQDNQNRNANAGTQNSQALIILQDQVSSFHQNNLQAQGSTQQQPRQSHYRYSNVEASDNNIAVNALNNSSMILHEQQSFTNSAANQHHGSLVNHQQYTLYDNGSAVAGSQGDVFNTTSGAYSLKKRINQPQGQTKSTSSYYGQQLDDQQQSVRDERLVTINEDGAGPVNLEIGIGDLNLHSGKLIEHYQNQQNLTNQGMPAYRSNVAQFNNTSISESDREYVASVQQSQPQASQQKRKQAAAPAKKADESLSKSYKEYKLNRQRSRSPRQKRDRSARKSSMSPSRSLSQRKAPRDISNHSHVSRDEVMPCYKSNFADAKPKMSKQAKPLLSGSFELSRHQPSNQPMSQGNSLPWTHTVDNSLHSNALMQQQQSSSAHRSTLDAPRTRAVATQQAQSHVPGKITQMLKSGHFRNYVADQAQVSQQHQH